MASIQSRLNQLAQHNSSRRKTWLDYMSLGTQETLTEAANLYLAGETAVTSISDLYRFMSEIVATDYPKDLPKWPAEATFRKWMSEPSSVTQPKEPKPSQPVNLKPRSVQKPKKGSI